MKEGKGRKGRKGRQEGKGSEGTSHGTECFHETVDITLDKKRRKEGRKEVK